MAEDPLRSFATSDTSRGNNSGLGDQLFSESRLGRDRPEGLSGGVSVL